MVQLVCVKLNTHPFCCGVYNVLNPCAWELDTLCVVSPAARPTCEQRTHIPDPVRRQPALAAQVF